MASRDSNFLNNFKIPDYILVPESKVESVKVDDDVPKCPVLVFVNSRSGGQLGGDLLKTYRTVLNEKQVYLLIILMWDVSRMFKFVILCVGLYL